MNQKTQLKLVSFIHVDSFVKSEKHEQQYHGHMIFSLGLGAFHKEKANGHVPTGGQRDGVSHQ